MTGVDQQDDHIPPQPLFGTWEADLRHLVTYYDGERFLAWLGRVSGSGFGHGGELVQMIRGTDNVVAAERFLVAAEACGLIRRFEPATPTIHQRVMGVGGVWTNLVSATVHGYQTTTAGDRYVWTIERQQRHDA